ncbi:hypothetical protein HKBW3S44_01786, partial [Candidatus Hakubella thermalkaliphila]
LLYPEFAGYLLLKLKGSTKGIAIARLSLKLLYLPLQCNLGR